MISKNFNRMTELFSLKTTVFVVSVSPPYMHMSGKDMKNAHAKPPIGRSDNRPPVLPRVPIHTPLTPPGELKLIVKMFQYPSNLYLGSQ